MSGSAIQTEGLFGYKNKKKKYITENTKNEDTKLLIILTLSDKPAHARRLSFKVYILVYEKYSLLFHFTVYPFLLLHKVIIIFTFHQTQY